MDSSFFNSDWLFGNQFNAYYTDPSKVGAWEATRKLNAEAAPSPIVGFVFDQTPVKTELALIQAICEEYQIMATSFLELDEVLPQYIDHICSTGSDTVSAENNKQLEEWHGVIL